MNVQNTGIGPSSQCNGQPLLAAGYNMRLWEWIRERSPAWRVADWTEFAATMCLWALRRAIIGLLLHGTAHDE